MRRTSTSQWVSEAGQPCIRHDGPNDDAQDLDRWDDTIATHYFVSGSLLVDLTSAINLTMVLSPKRAV